MLKYSKRLDDYQNRRFDNLNLSLLLPFIPSSRFLNKISIVLILAWLNICLSPLESCSQIVISGRLEGILAGDTTYLVTDDIGVQAGDSLIIEPGAILKASMNLVDFTIDGYVSAVGTLEDSIRFITNGVPSLRWGRIYINPASEVRFEYCLIAKGAYGIAIDSSSPVIRNCTLSDQNCEGVMKCNNSNVTIENCSFLNSHTGWTAFYGGAACSQEGSSVTLLNCLISDCSAGASGGGAACLDSSQLIIDNCVFENSRAFGSTGCGGGGVYVDFNANAEISNCTFIGNNGTWGGAIRTMGTCTIDHCVIAENAAGWGAGGIYLDGDASVINCTFVNNTAQGTPGFASVSSAMDVLSFGEKIIYNNAFYGAGPTSLVGIAADNNDTLRYNCFFNNGFEVLGFEGTPIQGLGELSTVNANGDSSDQYYNIFSDPLFIDAGAGNFQLTEDSPCIDAGSPFSPLDPDSTIADIGAFYYYQQSNSEPLIEKIPPVDFALSAPYPNPFNSLSTITYSLQSSGDIRLSVHDILGREVSVLKEGLSEQGHFTVDWNAENLPSGVYFLRLQQSDNCAVKKSVLLK